MTRFARGKGSKACNEKAPEDGTPWEVMKEQLLQSKKQNDDAKKRHEVETQRIENYVNFLKEQKVQKRKATWCEFPEAKQLKQKHFTDCTQNGEQAAKKKKKNKKRVETETQQSSEHTKTSNMIAVDTDTTKKKSKKKNKSINKSIEVKNQQTGDNKLTVVREKKSKKGTKYILENVSGDTSQTDIQQYPKNEPGKKKKQLVGKPIRRKEINDHSFQLIINGKEVELVRFDGFPIMKRDAERLEELKNNMVKKGIPKSEVQRTMKLERRRAEKALARLKREVCYNCRKGGHNLSDCPDLKSKIPGVDAPDGVCFKCGSTEHKQFECKVQKENEFKFATCFICKEPGHIARQCPDNPKGLYPNGGCCKLCGDVTHMRKDCPTVKDIKEGSSIKLHTLNGEEHIEDIGQPEKSNISQDTSKKPKKIKFF